MGSLLHMIREKYSIDFHIGLFILEWKCFLCGKFFHSLNADLYSEFSYNPISSPVAIELYN